MDFAHKILGKYGWKEGEGLGKNSNGISKPLKATLKFDNAGFGADLAAADFNNHWWERVFNEAANNVDVKKDGDTVKMDLKVDEEGVEISTKGYSMKKLKKAKRQRENNMANGYDNFLQAATLTNLGGEIENPNKIDLSDIEVTKINVLTDEELFMACGGRTAHKGARHGLKLSGKLSRIEQQEEELLAKMLANRYSIENAKKSANEKSIKQKVKVEKIEHLGQDSIQKSIKKKKKDKLKEEPEVLTSVEECNSDQIKNDEIKTKKKKRKHCENNFEEDTTSVVSTDNKIKKSKKNNVPETETSTNLTIIHTEPKKKKKKNKVHIVLEDIEHPEPASKKYKDKVVLIDDSNETTIHVKKKKCKKAVEIIIKSSKLH